MIETPFLDIRRSLVVEGALDDHANIVNPCSSRALTAQTVL